MRTLAVLFVTAALAACSPPTQQADQAQWDMGPMPPVAALYDREAPPSTLDERTYYFTRDLAEALSAHDTPIDFDYRSWANDPEIERQTFGLSETPPEDRAVVVTRFTYPGIGDGMIVSYTLCRRGPSDWKIEDVEGRPVPADLNEPATTEAVPSLREMLALPPVAASCD
jgi:hypothetical protein